MTRHIKSLLFSFLILISGTAAAGTLSKAEADGLQADISSLLTQFEAGDADALISRTHPSLVALAGGPQAYATLTRGAMAQLMTQGITFVSLDLGQPTPTYPAGDEEVCFVPKVSVVEIEGRRVRSTSFMIAIRNAAGGPWSYLDGAGLKDRPEMLHQLLPTLPKGIALPPNLVELMP